MRSLPLAAVLVVAAACATPLKTTVISFTDLDCGDCGESMAKALIAVDGVQRTTFDAKTAELTVSAEPSIDVFSLAKSKKPADEAWGLELGAGKGRYLPWEAKPSGADVQEIANGGADLASLESLLASGKVTLVDFSAAWCEPCRELDAFVTKELFPARNNLAYRRLDIGDWDTPLALRYLKGVKALPFVQVYDARGQIIGTVSGFDKAGLVALIDKAEKNP